ncbi:GNAT family N-acetyltransferase [Paenibacillus sp. PSB04]|uniref:GNAT family N-acetyltransferase n=1 Tax=Paenibacillus sp. PSB04 TaxID=2866810 RepID=UPI0021F19171|nr:GNAT family protein [Paenibacillus sp. PSB04]
MIIDRASRTSEKLKTCAHLLPPNGGFFLSFAYVIGAICIAFYQPFDHGELAYWIGKPYSNHGYCTEAAKGIVRYAFEEMRLNRVFARHFGKNPASGKVMAKVGMKYEGTLRQHAKKQGKYEDLVYYGLLKEEHLSMK